MRRKIISNDYASFTVTYTSEIPERTIKYIGKMLLVIDLAEYILKYHLEEPKYLNM